MFKILKLYIQILFKNLFEYYVQYVCIYIFSYFVIYCITLQCIYIYTYILDMFFLNHQQTVANIT